MKQLLEALFTVSLLAAAIAGCTASGSSVHTAADTQPRPYMQDVTNPQNQPQFDRTGAIHY